MGISLNGAFKSFKKVPKEYYRPKYEDKMDVSDELFDSYEKMASESGLVTIYEMDFVDNFYKQFNFDLEKKYTQKFIDLVKQAPDSELKTWLLQNEGKHITFDYNFFYVATELEAIIGEQWVGEDYISVNEDGRLLMYAMDNLKYRYGIDLYPSVIYSEDLQRYNYQNSPELLAKINCDSVKLGLEAEEKLKHIKKQEDDEFFEERMPRIQLLIEALKQGAKFTYSV